VIIMSRTTATLPAPAVERDDDELTGLHTVAPSTHPARDAVNTRRITTAQKGVVAAEAELVAAVAAARAAGDSWTLIGAALGTTRQNAHQRFGKIID
jgi:hypothetical protein